MFLLFFCLDAKEKVTKEKIKAALFWLLRSGIPLKKKNSLRSNSFFFLTFHPSPSASRQKSEAYIRLNIASLVWVDVFYHHVIQTTIRRKDLGYIILRNIHLKQRSALKIHHWRAWTKTFYEPPTSTSKAMLSPPLEDRPLVEEREEFFALSREEEKAV